MTKLKIDRLGIIIFIAGSVVMVLELIGSRILAPYLGTSIYVWASLIGIILGALTLGYYLGGRFSNTNPKLSFLAQVLFLAGLSILLITVIKEPVIVYCLKFGIKLGSVLATLILFALPSLILGIVSPYAIRLKVQNVEESGGVAGNLYALSTIGSIFGTFLAGFYLIPTFGSTQILFGLSFVLLITSLLGGKKIIKIAFLGLVIALWLLNLVKPTPFVYEADSTYNHITVKDQIYAKNQRPVRSLYLATESHSIIYRDSPELFSVYQYLYQLDNLFKPEIKNALTLGGGAYLAPMDFLKRKPNAKMTVVEIDPQVTEVAKKFFNLKPDPRLTIFHEDGRIFLNNNQAKYDVVYGDAYASFYSIPFQLTTKEAMKRIYDSLADDGILVLNVISALAGEKSIFFQAEYKTIKEYFPQVYIFPAHFYDGSNTDKFQNIILIATKNNQRLSLAEMQQMANEEQKPLLNHLWQKEPANSSKIKVLTDEFAPVDFYISKLL
ncbi:MAG: fused MFS/spermidine synthase [Candidatus Buchananbacteria bacterium]